jgi:hypothetical protein
MLHNNMPMLQEFAKNSPKKNVCTICDYKCYKKSDFEKHLSSTKHKCNKGENKCNSKFAKQADLTCDKCHKTYQSRTGIWRHKKTCEFTIEKEVNESNESNDLSENVQMNVEEDSADPNIVNILIKENIDFKHMIMDLVKNNNELQLQMLEICKNSNTTTNSHNNTHSHNKTFNLQVFLNEECKDAMNMSEFIKNIVLQSSNLLEIGELGYVEGISKIIIKEMNEIEQNKRPLHCSDAKRETMYIREENKWEKEGPDHHKLMCVIKDIEKKNMGVLLNEWMPEHPEHRNSESSVNNDYLKLMKETMNGSPDNINKVIKRIAKEVMIDKKKY